MGALGGAVAGAVPGAAWGDRMADGANAALGAALLAGVGAVSGAATGAVNAMLPARRGWKKYAQAVAIGMVVSGLSFWAIGEVNGNVGPIHPAGFGAIGLGHGAITGVVVVKFGG